MGFLPAVYNQGLFALCINVFSCRLSTVWFSGMTCARGLVSRPATCAGSPPISPSFLGSNHKTRKKWGEGRKGQRGGVLGSPFLGFRAFTKQGLLNFLLPSCVTSSNLPGSVVCVSGLQKVFFPLQAQNFILKNRSGYSQNSLHFWWFLTYFNSNLA